MRHCLLLLLFLLPLSGQCQEPFYFIFGQSEFEGVDIYDVIQDNDYNYWFSTDQGLILHDGYSFRKVSVPQMKASSLFDFKADSKGRIYCHNLSHQIYRIQDQKVSLFYEVPEKEQQFAISYTLDADDYVLIQSESLIRVSPDGKDEIILDNNSATYPFLKGEKAIYSFQEIDITESIQVISKNKTKSARLTSNQELPTSKAYYWDVREKSDIIISRGNMNVYRFDEKHMELEYQTQLRTDLNNQSLRIYSVDERIWLMGQTRGVYLIDEQFNPLYGGYKLYENYFISDVYKDREGNTLLSTFDHGVLVIPNKFLRRIPQNTNETVTQIATVTNQEGLLFGMSSGEISFSLQGQQTTISQSDVLKPLETLYYWEQRDAILTDGQLGIQIIDHFQKQPKEYRYEIGAFKAFAAIDHEKAVVGFNSGITTLRFRNGAFETSNDFKTNTRIYALAYLQEKDLVYAGTSQGLQVVERNGASHTFQYKGKSVFANCLFEHDGQIFVGTKRSGVLVIEDGRVVLQIPVSDEVMKISIDNDICYIQTRSGFYMHEFSVKKTTKLNTIFGLKNRKIIDFGIDNDIIYISTVDGIQYISLNQLNRPTAALPIHDFRVLKGKKPTRSKHFKYNQSSIRFEFSVATLRFREGVKYQYKLKGYDSEWRELPYDQNYVVYNALAPGDYTFLVRSENQGIQSKSVSYSFEVEAPFYLRWWFYLSCSLGILAILILIVRRRLKIQQRRVKREQELNASKLTAIQSQMNPHFIFNTLNSIQDLVMQGDAEKSYSSITRFANLVRRTLNYSDKDTIDFDEEIKLLELYLTLEKLRFKDELQFDIKTNGIEGVRIPPMLIQPFIENALQHGLLHKEGIGTLMIEFELKDMLVCTITDNGIGRKKAREIKARQKGKHESFAIKSIKKRMEILSQRFGDGIGFEYEDLIENGSPSGTMVTLYLPIERHF